MVVPGAPAGGLVSGKAAAVGRMLAENCVASLDLCELEAAFWFTGLDRQHALEKLNILPESADLFNLSWRPDLDVKCNIMPELVQACMRMRCALQCIECQLACWACQGPCSLTNALAAAAAATQQLP